MVSLLPKKVFALFLCIVVFVLSINVTAFAKTNFSERTLKVFMPLQFGFVEKDENGKLSGYTYDYLMKIAQLGGWKYEFIFSDAKNNSLLEGLDKVKSGEIDLAGSMVYTETLAQDYIYSHLPSGATNFTLVALEENGKINARTLSNTPDLKIALVENSAMQNSLLDEYAKQNNFTYTPVYASKNADAFSLVKEGKADAAISKDVNNKDGFKTVCKIAPQPFYFAASKDNKELIEELNRILADLNTTDPYFQDELHKKYFTKKSDFVVSLTGEEQEYIETSPAIKIVVAANRAPLHSYNAETGEYSGILIDIINLISEKTGLKFEYTAAENNEQMQNLFDTSDADMLAGVAFSYQKHDNFDPDKMLITSPIFTAPIVRLANINNNGANPETLVYQNINVFDNKKDIKYIDELSHIFDLVNSGEYAEAYVNGYMAQHYAEQNYMENVIVTTTPFSNYELSLAAKRNIDLRVMSILEQGIASITPTEIEDIIYRNTMHSQQLSLVQYFERNPMQFIVPIIIFLAVITILSLMLVLKTQRMNKIISEEKNKFKEISLTDKLTNSLNNQSFKALAKEFLKLNDPIPCGALLICDLDNFKGINDTRGHLAGDEILSGVGLSLSTVFRDENLIGRLGGDEFAVLIKENISAELLAQRCDELLSKCTHISENLTVTLSIGAVLFTGTHQFDELFRYADNALYDVKKSGKNNYKICDFILTDIADSQSPPEN